MTTSVYLNHAGCSKVSRQTLETILRQNELEATFGVFESDQRVASEKRAFYELAADLLGADPSDIAYTDSHTSGWDKALRRVRLGPGDVLFTSRGEWGGNLKALRTLAHAHGADVQLMPLTSKGTVCVERLAKTLSTRVKLISLTWLGSNGGDIEPAAEMGQLAQSFGIPYFLDASQVVGQLPVDVNALKCDVLTTPGRKWLRGPRGSGLMYVRPSFLERTHGSFEPEGQEARMRQLEPTSHSLPLMLGLASALQQLKAERSALRPSSQSVLDKSRWIWEALRDLPKVTCLSEQAPRHGLVSFTVEGLSASEVKRHLMARGVEVAANQAAFTPLDMQARQLDAVVRASAHTCTTQAEIEKFIGLVAQL